MLDRGDDDLVAAGVRSEAARIAVLSLSVPPEVNRISSPKAAPTSAATCSRAAFIACRLGAPKACADDGLPKCSVRNGSIAATTSGSTRVVALLSR